MKRKSSDKSNLDDLREQINHVDLDIIKLLSKRREISKKVIIAKNEFDKPLRDQKRESELLAKLISLGAEYGLDSFYLLRIFNEIIHDSVRIQQGYLYNKANARVDEERIFRIAIQGIEGAYSYLAAKKYFSHIEGELIFINKHRFEEVIKTVENGEADFAVLPIENTTSGSINEVYDLLSHTTASIVGEEIFRVKHCLVSISDVPIESITKIYAHYQAAAQCSRFISTLPNCKVEYFVDTAMSVQKIKDENDPSYAAIASEEAAKLFGVKIIRENIANQDDNFTRFLVASRNPQDVDERIPAKTSLTMAIENKPGSLVGALSVLQKYNVNMTKLESRPILGNPWEEMFYLDFEGNIKEENIKNMLDELKLYTRVLKILGCYPSRETDKIADKQILK